LSVVIAFSLLVAGLLALAWLVLFAKTFSLLFVASAITVAALAAGWIYEDWTEWFPRRSLSESEKKRGGFKTLPTLLMIVVFGLFAYMDWPIWVPIFLVAAYAISELESTIWSLRYDLERQREELEIMATQIKSLNRRVYGLEDHDR
jgi:hypothetical protein